MVAPLGLAGSSLPPTKVAKTPKFGDTPPTVQTVNNMAKDLSSRIDQLTGELSKQTGLTTPTRTPEQEAAFQKQLKAAAKLILKIQNNIPKPASNVLQADETGVSHRPLPSQGTDTEQKRFFESVAQNVFDQNIKPQFAKAQQLKDEVLKQREDAYKNSYRYKIAQTAQSIWGSILNRVASIASVIAPTGEEPAASEAVTQGPNAASPATPNSQAGSKPKEEGAQERVEIEDTDKLAKEVTQSIFQNVLKAQADSEGQQPENKGAEAPKGGQTVQGATDPKAVDDKTSTEATKPADDKKETNADKKEEQNWKSGYIGWKAGIGAALLAGGIALKMTLIGIIPGLIMAGVGAALLGWSGINWLSKDK